MAEDDETPQPQQWTIEHVEAPQFRTIFASGAVFSGPIDPGKHWVLTFYSDGARIRHEVLVGTPEEGFRPGSPPIIEADRVRRDEVSIVMTESQLTGLVSAITRQFGEVKK